jgi:hypothetical protein
VLTELVCEAAKHAYRKPALFARTWSRDSVADYEIFVGTLIECEPSRLGCIVRLDDCIGLRRGKEPYHIPMKMLLFELHDVDDPFDRTISAVERVHIVFGRRAIARWKTRWRISDAA